MLSTLPSQLHLSRSSALFHYTKDINTLQNILKYGFYPFYCLEQLPFGGTNPEIAFPMVCFCDIPISRISEHLRFYGTYGLAMDKNNWGIGHKINPILYISDNSGLSKSIEMTIKGAKKLKEEYNEDQYLKNIRHICAYIKKINGKAKALDGEYKDKNFYLENEWRYVPKSLKIRPYLKKEEYDNPKILSDNNKIANKEGCIAIHPNDIRYIVVETDWDVDDLIKFIENELTDCSDDRKKQLISRILPMEFILQDI